MGMEHCIVMTTVSTAAWTLGKLTTAAAVASGCACSRTVALVIIPRIPSEPTNKLVKLRPADDFFGRLSLPPVCKMLPSAKITSRFRQFSLIVPYLVYTKKSKNIRTMEVLQFKAV